MSITIGVDIGGSHISSAAIYNDNFNIIENTYFSGPINSKASKEEILGKWAEIINQTITAIKNTSKYNKEATLGIAFSMPGPFQYSTGIAMFEGNDKYESLYNVSIGDELLKYLDAENVSFRFLNDASCFGVGGAFSYEKESDAENVIAITLGTGFGAAFLENKLPLTNGENIPENGCLWDKKFSDDIADNYFSTRWFIDQYENATGEKLTGGVKEIAFIENDIVKKIFDDFAFNICEFLTPFIVDFDAKMLIIGGNIAKSKHLFLSKVQENFKNKGIKLHICIVENTEETSILGSTCLFNEAFWDKMKDNLPVF